MQDAQVVRASDGCQLASRLEGPEGAQVLVLSNSLGTDHTLWAGQVAALAGRFRILRYDTRGHGASDAPEGEYSIERLGTDVVDLLDAHGLARVHFCGLSIGGMTGQWLAANAPGRIERLVLANTAALLGPASAWQARIDQVREAGMPAIADAVIERWFTPQFRQRSPEVVAGIKASLLATPPRGYAGCCAAIRDLDLRESAARIFAPTLMVVGARDPATPPDCSREIARALPNPPKVVTLDTAHLSNLEQPAAFSRALLEFLS